MPKREFPGASWEEFDAEALFPPPRIHTNRLVKLDKREMQYVPQEELDEQLSAPSGEQGEPQDGDTYTDASPEQGHADELFEMEGLSGGQADNREVKADKEEDRRTEKPEESEAEPDEGEADDSQGTPSEDGQDSPEAKEQSEADGAENPIQKESEDIQDVADATSQTSEDVHGGDEATKDIESSPNAADDGQNPDNQGAEAGEGGDEGKESAGDSTWPAGEKQSPNNTVQGGSGEGDTSEQSEKSNPLAQEDWEAKADHSAMHLAPADTLEEFAAKEEREETGHRTSLPSYQFDRKESPVELEVAFKKAKELIQKLAAEEDLTARVAGQQRWDAKALLRSVVSYRHPRIPSSRYERPREADIVILLDISGSCQAQSEMFMAIASGAVGNGVRIFIGYNGSARASAMQAPTRLPRSYNQAKAWVQSEVNRVSGWHNAAIGEWSFRQLVEEVKPKTLIIFGDWDGIDQYQDAVSTAKFHATRFFWFANEGRPHSQDAGRPKIPKGWTKKNYFPGVYRPRDLVRALRKVK